MWGENGAPGLRDLGVSWPFLRTAYVKACRKHMAHSATTRREHRFEDRFATTLRLLEIEQLPEMAVLSRWANQFGELIAQDAEMVDGADEVIEELGRHVRLAIVSNYPHAPVVYGTLERLGLRRHFCAVVVSSELSWLKRILSSIARRSLALERVQRRQCSLVTISTTISELPRRWGCVQHGSRLRLPHSPPRPISRCPICGS